MKLTEIKLKQNRTREANFSQTMLIAHDFLINGQLEPIVLDDANEIISGNHRFYAALILGWNEIETKRFWE